MTHSILDDCLKIYKKGENYYPHEIVDYFTSINVNTFDPLLKTEYESLWAAKVVIFILCAFSEDSPMVVSRQDAVQEKEHICDYLDVTDPEQRITLVYMKDQNIRECIANYLVQFCGEEFRSFMFMRIQLQDYEYDITRRQFRVDETVKTDDEENPTKVVVHYDPKEHNKAVMERDKLAKRIEQSEKLMAAKIKRIGINNLDEWKRRGGASGQMKRRTGEPERLVNNTAAKNIQNNSPK